MYREQVRKVFALFVFLFTIPLSIGADSVVFRELSSFGKSDPVTNDRFGWSVAVLGDGRVAASGNPAIPTQQPSFCIFEEQEDGWVEEACVSVGPSDEESFWFNIAADGGIIVAGVPSHDEPPCCNAAGAVYFYEEDGTGSWHETQVLVDDWWLTGSVGWHVDIQGDTAVIGASSDNTVAAGAGAAYVFERQSLGVWDQVAKLLPDSVDGDFQRAGYNVALSEAGNMIVVGAPGATTTNGRAYLYERSVSSGSWSHTETLDSGDPLPDDSFGITVDISENRVLVGAPGGFNDTERELAYVFTNTVGVWEQTAELRPWGIAEGESFWFGASSISFNESEAYIESAGHVYVFTHSGEEWRRTAKLFSGEEFSYFGKAFDFLGDDKVVFGSPAEDGLGDDEGGVHVFSREIVNAVLPHVPTIFIHGLASSSNTWNELGTRLIGDGVSYGGNPIYDPATGEVSGVLPGDFYQMNFSDFDDDPFPAQNLTFAEQGQELAAVIREVRSANDNISEVLLVSHSMGGLAARTYLQGFATDAPYREDVLRLITVGTPHQGSFLAAICGIIPGICEFLGIDPGSVAVAELEPGSDTLIELNDIFENPLSDDVAYTTIVGLGQDTVGESGDEPGDGIVTQDSQDPPFFVPPWEVVSVVVQDCGEHFLHTCETTDSAIQQKILRRIKSGIFSDGFESGDTSAWE